MPSLAFYFFCVVVSEASFIYAVADIFAMRGEKEVIGVDTGRHIAAVTDFHAVRNRASRHRIHEARDALIFSVMPREAVPATILSVFWHNPAFPNPAPPFWHWL